MSKFIEIDINELRSMLRLDAETGLLYWLVNRGPARAGSVAGCKDGQGYIVIGIKRRLYGAHRVAWALHHGRWPENEVDHEDRNKSNNRPRNLRSATHAQNLANVARPSTNTSGRKGVTWSKAASRWQASIKVGGKFKYLGLFDCIDDAANAYAQAANETWGKFACTA